MLLYTKIHFKYLAEQKHFLKTIKTKNTDVLKCRKMVDKI